MSKVSISQELKNAIKDVEKNIDKYTSGPCERIAFEVLKDSELQDAFVKVIIEGYDFNQVICEPFGLDQTRVRFRFRCGPGKICIQTPALRVTYDHSLKKRVGPIEYLQEIF